MSLKQINKILQDFGQYKVDREQLIKEDIKKEIKKINVANVILNPDAEFQKLKDRVILMYVEKYLLDLIKKKDKSRDKLIKELKKLK